MKTEPKLSQLVEYDQNAGKVMTIVVNVDQSVAVNRNHEFEILVKSRLHEIETGIAAKEEREQFARCAELGMRLLQSYRPRTKSVVLFLQANGNVSTRELNVPLSTEVFWAAIPHIQPLIEAKDEFEEILIVLLDGRHSRLLTSTMGNLTEHPEVVNPFPSSHTQAPGNDRQKSQPTFHRKSDERERHYLQAVSKAVEVLTSARSIDRIVLAGNDVAFKALYSQLPGDVRKHVISFAVLPVQATLNQISVTAAKAQTQAERENEVEKVVELLNRARARDRAVTGLPATVSALSEGRVHELVYAQGLSPEGALCSKCGSIVVGHATCPNCLSVAGPAGDAMDLILGSALEIGASIEQVRGEAADRLAAAGGIGALLRY